jgi:hypothetical protein
MAKAEPLRDATNGIVRGSTAANGAEHLGHDPSHPRR